MKKLLSVALLAAISTNVAHAETSLRNLPKDRACIAFVEKSLMDNSIAATSFLKLDSKELSLIGEAIFELKHKGYLIVEIDNSSDFSTKNKFGMTTYTQNIGYQRTADHPIDEGEASEYMPADFTKTYGITPLEAVKRNALIIYPLSYEKGSQLEKGPVYDKYTYPDVLKLNIGVASHIEHSAANAIYFKLNNSTELSVRTNDKVVKTKKMPCNLVDVDKGADKIFDKNGNICSVIVAEESITQYNSNLYVDLLKKVPSCK